MGHCDRVFRDDLNRDYHDNEWGIPVHDDRHMFEHLTMECLQCGLSWGLMMKKREIFRACFDNFDYDVIAGYDDSDVQRAIINNARCCRDVRAEYGSFCAYIWGYTDGNTILYDGHGEGHIPARNGLSERISADLKKRGFKFVGPVTIYSHLQACGIINDHASDCPCYRRICQSYPTIRMKPDREG